MRTFDESGALERLLRLNHIGLNQAEVDGGERFNGAGSSSHRSQIKSLARSLGNAQRNSNESIPCSKSHSKGSPRSIPKRCTWVRMGRSGAGFVSFCLLVFVYHAQWESRQDVRCMGVVGRHCLGLFLKVPQCSHQQPYKQCTNHALGLFS